MGWLVEGVSRWVLGPEGTPKHMASIDIMLGTVIPLANTSSQVLLGFFEQKPGAAARPGTEGKDAGPGHSHQ